MFRYYLYNNRLTTKSPKPHINNLDKSAGQSLSINDFIFSYSNVDSVCIISTLIFEVSSRLSLFNQKYLPIRYTSLKQMHAMYWSLDQNKYEP